MDIDNTISVIAAIFGAFILLYGVCSLVIKQKLYISEACMCTQKENSSIVLQSIFINTNNSYSDPLWDFMWSNWF